MDDGERLTAVIRLPREQALPVLPGTTTGAAGAEPAPADDDGDELGAAGAAHKIHVKVQQDGVRHAARFRVCAAETTVQTLLAAYCRRARLDPAAVTLRFDGAALRRDRTLADCDIEDDDVIDAVVRP